MFVAHKETNLTKRVFERFSRSKADEEEEEKGEIGKEKSNILNCSFLILNYRSRRFVSYITSATETHNKLKIKQFFPFGVVGSN